LERQIGAVLLGWLDLTVNLADLRLCALPSIIENSFVVRATCKLAGDPGRF
jgi:hypothetical protein